MDVEEALKQKHVERLIQPQPSFIMNSSQPNIFILHHSHFPTTFNIPCINNLVGSIGGSKIIVHYSPATRARKTELLPNPSNGKAVIEMSQAGSIFTNNSRDLAIASDGLLTPGDFPFLHQQHVPGSNHVSNITVVTNSEKWISESDMAVFSKQHHEQIYAMKDTVAINNPDGKGCGTLCNRGLSNNVVQRSDDAIVPCGDLILTGSCRYDLDCEECPNPPDRFEESPTVPDMCEAKLQSTVCMGTSYQGSCVTPITNISPVVTQPCYFNQCCFTAEKESLVDEESDYELKLSPDQESRCPQQHDNVEILTSHSSQVSCNEGNHHVTVSSMICTAESINKADLICQLSEFADDGRATLLQDLPSETARQTDTEILQVCHKTNDDSADDTDRDSDSTSAKTQLPNQKCFTTTNDMYNTSNESVRPFTSKLDHHSHICCSDSSSQMSSDDMPFWDSDSDGPSKLLKAMQLMERKGNHNLSTWERILFNGSCYDTFRTTKLNLTRPKLRLGLSRRHKCKPLHPYYRAGTV